VVPFIFQNRVRGKIYGGEIDAAWNVMKGWRVESVYSFARIILENKGGSTDGVTVPQKQGMTPRSQFSFRSRTDLPGGFEFDPTVRYVDGMPIALVPSYWTADLHLGWNLPRGVELALVGQNLLQPRHAESTENVNEIQRGFYAKATWRWQP